MWVWEIGERFGLDHLRKTERALPEPGPRQVRIRPTAWSLNYRDWMVATGTYNPRQKLPLVPLSDGVGRIDAVGEGVARARVGDRVAAVFAQKWLSGPPDKIALGSTLGAPHDGMAAEAVVLDEEGVVHVPAHLSDAEAATLPCAAVTAWSALFEHASVGPGHSVLVQGSGGVSVFALAFARLAGARVIATSSSAEKRERLLALGASEVIDYRADPQWGKSARTLTGGLGVDVVVEVGGAGTIEQSLTAVRSGGTVAVIGALSGGAGPVPLTRVLMSQVRLQGVFVGPRAAFEHMNRAIESAMLRPVVDRVFAIDALPEALAALAEGRHFGKIVLTL